MASVTEGCLAVGGAPRSLLSAGLARGAEEGLAVAGERGVDDGLTGGSQGAGLLRQFGELSAAAGGFGTGTSSGSQFMTVSLLFLHDVCFP